MWNRPKVITFLGETRLRFALLIYATPIFVHSTRNQLLEYLENRLTYRRTKFYGDIHTDIVYIHTGYDIIIYFRSEVIGGKPSILPLPTASGGISREWLQLGSWNFKPLSGINGHTNMPEMASPAHSGRLQNGIKYYRKVRKTGPNCRKGLITRKWCQIRQKVVLTTNSKPWVGIPNPPFFLVVVAMGVSETLHRSPGNAESFLMVGFLF